MVVVFVFLLFTCQTVMDIHGVSFRWRLRWHLLCSSLVVAFLVHTFLTTGLFPEGELCNFRISLKRRLCNKNRISYATLHI